MDALFAPNANYHVRAKVNSVSLETSSIIRSGDKIAPYFAVSVENDPDLTGLLVSLRNLRGEIVGSRVRYVIGIPADEPEETGSAEEYATPEDDTDSPQEGSAESRRNAGVQAGTQAAAGDSETVITVRSFAQDLPYFTTPADMEIGPHFLVFEVIGGRITLNRTEVPVFYLGNAEFSLRDISMSLPGLFDTRIVPPGTKVLLEAGLDFDSRLDPYIVWRSGRNIIRQGRISDGAGSILWETPRQAAFHPLRVEVLPFWIRGNAVGISRDIMLPVSATSESVGFFFGTGSGHPARNRLAEGTFHRKQVHAEDLEGCDYEVVVPPELYRWFQFKGLLHDTVSAEDEERCLVPAVDESIPRWTSIGASYGLSTGHNDAFLLSSVSFFREDRDHGGGIFLFHVRPVADGTIFSVSFPACSPASGGAWIDLARVGDAMVLRLGTEETTIEMPVFLSGSELRTLVPVAVKFYIDPYRLEANLSLGENAFLQSTVQGVMLSGALTGEGLVRLGGAPLASWTRAPALVFADVVNLAEPPAEYAEAPDPDENAHDPETREEDAAPPAGAPAFAADSIMEAANERISPSVATVWNEFAVMFSSMPFPRPIPEAEEPEDEYPEAIPAQGAAIAAPALDARQDTEPRPVPPEPPAVPEDEIRADAPPADDSRDVA